MYLGFHREHPVITTLIVIFVIWWIISQPAVAGHDVQHIGHGIESLFAKAASGISAFLSAL